MNSVKSLNQDQLKHLSQADRKTLSYVVQNKSFPLYSHAAISKKMKALDAKIESLKTGISEASEKKAPPESSGKSLSKGLKQAFKVRVASKSLHDKIKKQPEKDMRKMKREAYEKVKKEISNAIKDIDLE